MQPLRTINRALETAWRQGYRALRSHLDLGGRAGSQATWEAVTHTWDAWSDRLQLQAVALAPLEFGSTAAGVRLARQLARISGGRENIHQEADLHQCKTCVKPCADGADNGLFMVKGGGPLYLCLPPRLPGHRLCSMGAWFRLKAGLVVKAAAPGSAGS